VNGELSENTQAILLLTAPLIVGRSSGGERPLSASDYSRLAVRLRELKRQPADLLTAQADEILQACQPLVHAAQVHRLLGRGFQLSQAVERWRSRAIWVMSRADATYPRRLKTRLNGAAPPVLYGCGEMALLEQGGLAVVGSRDVDAELIAYSEKIGQLASQAKTAVVSGGARGVDQAAMQGALQGQGKAVGMLADSLEQAALHRAHRDALLEKRLVLVSPYDPSAGFNVGHAMQRNKLIYALADVALVVNSDVNKGGTWAGAIEQLEKLRFVRVYVRSTGKLGQGIVALQRNGAAPWPNPSSGDELMIFVKTARPPEAPAAAQSDLPLAAPAEESLRRNHS
jgi:DNA processing protein